MTLNRVQTFEDVNKNNEVLSQEIGRLIDLINTLTNKVTVLENAQGTYSDATHFVQDGGGDPKAITIVNGLITGIAT